MAQRESQALRVRAASALLTCTLATISACASPPPSRATLPPLRTCLDDTAIARDGIIVLAEQPRDPNMVVMKVSVCGHLTKRADRFVWTSDAHARWIAAEAPGVTARSHTGAVPHRSGVRVEVRSPTRSASFDGIWWRDEGDTSSPAGGPIPKERMEAESGLQITADWLVSPDDERVRILVNGKPIEDLRRPSGEPEIAVALTLPPRSQLAVRAVDRARADDDVWVEWSSPSGAGEWGARVAADAHSACWEVVGDRVTEGPDEAIEVVVQDAFFSKTFVLPRREDAASGTPL